MLTSSKTTVANTCDKKTHKFGNKSSNTISFSTGEQLVERNNGIITANHKEIDNKILTDFFIEVFQKINY
jgi:hypothetical protein